MDQPFQERGPGGSLQGKFGLFFWSMFLILSGYFCGTFEINSVPHS